MEKACRSSTSIFVLATLWGWILKLFFLIASQSARQTLHLLYCRSFNAHLLDVPQITCKKSGEIDFYNYAPKSWIAPPEEIRQASSVSNLKKQLKTCFYGLGINWFHLPWQFLYVVFTFLYCNDALCTCCCCCRLFVLFFNLHISFISVFWCYW